MERIRTVRVRRARVARAAGVCAAGALAALAGAVLATHDDAATGPGRGGDRQRGGPSDFAPRAGPVALAPRAAPDVSAPAPRAAPGPAPAAPLEPLAATWRAEVLRGGRESVLRGALALRRSPEGRAQLVVLARDEHPRVRAYALRALGEVRDPDLAPVFSAALVDPHPPARDNARWALGRLPAGPARAPASTPGSVRPPGGEPPGAPAAPQEHGPPAPAPRAGGRPS